MNIFEFDRIVGAGDEAVVKYFQDKHLLRKAVQCQTCGCEYSLIKKNGSVTGFQFRCPGCRKKESLSKNAFFDGSHLPLPKIFGLVYLEVATNTGRRTFSLWATNTSKNNRQISTFHTTGGALSFIVRFIFVNIVHIYRVSIRVRVRVRVSVRLKVSIT